MFNMFSALFTAIATFFAAFEKLGHATNHLATWAEESAGAFADQSRVERTAKLAKLNKLNNTNIAANPNAIVTTIEP